MCRRYMFWGGSSPPGRSLLCILSILGCPLLLGTVATPLAIAAEEVASVPAAPTELSSGDNAWVMASSALVLFMTAPGLAMFYGGLVRRKNVLGVIMQCLFLMAIMSIVWSLWGYSLAFGGSDRYLGNADHLFLRGIQLGDGGSEGSGRLYTPFLLAIPELTFMLFQGMFFIITPALICGAFAERMRFSTMVVFTILWGTLVYCPLCHWVWDGGMLAFGPSGIQGGALDFAGGTVVHISSGVSALVCAIVMGRRLGYGTEDMRPHNLTYTTLGAAMLWVGWFGFNAGSAGAANFLAANAMVVTHLSASAGAVAWAAMEWILRGKPSVLGTASGAVAGLVCITPASGFVQPMPAIVMGMLAGIVCYFACSSLKSTFRYDDSLDAFGVHGVGGTLGALLTGVFATKAVNTAGANGVFYDPQGGWQLLIGQATATGITILFAAIVSFVLLKVLDATMGLRLSQQGELQGLDLAEHGEEGYILN